MTTLLAIGCRTRETVPPGVPETPYWYMVADTAIWYLPSDSLAVVQLEDQTPPDSAQTILYTLRDMGWRLTPTRGPALRHAGSYQELTQWTYQVERVDDAVSPATDWESFKQHFSPSRRDGGHSYFYNIMPGLLLKGEGSPKYYWPSCVAIIWSKHTTVSQAKAWLDSLGCEIESSPQVSQMYFVQRTWSVLLPPRVRLFEWIRKLERDSRVLQAHPILANTEPPFPDGRLLGALPKEPDPPEFAKMTPSVAQAYWVSHFSETPVHAARITRIPAEFNKFHLLISTNTGPKNDSALVKRVGGRIVHSSIHRMDAWIPYDRLPELAADSTVVKIAGLTRPNTGP